MRLVKFYLPFFLTCYSLTANATIIGFDGGDCDPSSNSGIQCVIGDDTTIPDPVAKDPNNGILLVWDEKQNFTLTSDLKVDRVADDTASFVEVLSGGGFLIKAGTIVSSHYAQWDPKPGGHSRVDTTLSFDSDIFAFITADQKLFDSDFLGLPGLDYNDFTLRGLEPGDTTEYGADLSKVAISWAASSPGDWTRVITAFSPTAAVPEPSVLALISAGLIILGFARTRQQSA